MVLANSRKFSTELMLQKGIDEIINYVHKAEILDFSENELVFSEDSNDFSKCQQIWFGSNKENFFCTLVNLWVLLVLDIKCTFGDVNIILRLDFII